MLGDIGHLLPIVLGDDPDSWEEEFEQVPEGANLGEALQFLGAEKDEQRARVLAAIHRRLGNEVSVEEMLPGAVRLMTMHGAKGLSAQIVFIPGLEQQVLPGPRRQPYPGLVLEAARMLYVSITRARVGCIVSYARERVTHGVPTEHTPSEFANHLGAEFAPRDDGLSVEIAERAVAEAANL